MNVCVVVLDEFHAEIGDDRSIGQPQQFKVAFSGAYRIKAGGAKGGKMGTAGGGRGAVKEATFDLKCGDTLSLVLGKAGGDATAGTYAGAGGGGGTFVR